MKKVTAKDLKINLKSGKDSELFKWFIASILFGKPIQQEVAKRTYFEFERAGILDLKNILNAGWDRLVEILDRGHYVRYDFSTADRLIGICRELKEKYGSIAKLVKSSKNKRDLEKRLVEFKGIGPVTARIFLREIIRNTPRTKGRDFWCSCHAKKKTG